MIRIFRHYISASFFGLVAIELFVYFFAIYAGSSIRFQTLHSTNPTLMLSAGIFAVVMVVSASGMGLYQRTQLWGDVGVLLRIVGSFLIGALGMSLIFYLIPQISVGRGIFAYALLIALLAVVILRFVFYKLADGQILKRRILVLGAGKNAAKILALERAHGHQNIRVIGCIRLDDEPCSIPLERVVRLNCPLNEYAEQKDIDEIVVALDDRRKGLPLDEVLDCRMDGFDVVDLLTFFEREAGFVRVDNLYPSWLVFADGFNNGSIGLFVKRVFDISASVLLLFFMWPVMLLTMIAIAIESGGKGPIFYKQVRVGANWRLFEVIKFRSMRKDAEAEGQPQMAKMNDDRVTRVGAFIRKYRIDELPQLLNVIQGEMSFVGPRPERPEFVERFSETIPYYSERIRIKPGITGWAQLCYPYGETEYDAIQKLQYDLYYLKNYSLFLDLMIMLETIEVVLWRKGAR